MSTPWPFSVSETQQTRLVLDLPDGRTLAVMQQIFTVSPSAITRAELGPLLADHTSRDGDRWTTRIPGFPAGDDAVSADDQDALESEVAYKLNAYGVSIRDWSPYRLD